MVAAASGYALEGFPAAATTFAPFLVFRAFESIRHCLGYMGSPVLLAGIASGLALGELGYTHCAIEDVGLISNILVLLFMVRHIHSTFNLLSINIVFHQNLLILG